MKRAIGFSVGVRVGPDGSGVDTDTEIVERPIHAGNAIAIAQDIAAVEVITAVPVLCGAL